MAAMMILMAVFLVVPGSGGHMGLHGANDSPAQAGQSHEHGATKPDPEKPRPGAPIEKEEL